jgi:hypothetical protein
VSKVNKFKNCHLASPKSPVPISEDLDFSIQKYKFQNRFQNYVPDVVDADEVEDSLMIEEDIQSNQTPKFQALDQNMEFEVPAEFL